MPLDLAMLEKASAYLGTMNIVGCDLMNSGGAMSICFLAQSVVHKYIIFCGAPAHFIGSLGSVKIAFPPLNLYPKLAVFSAYL